MMNISYILRLVLLISAAMLLQACGDDDNSEPPAELVDFDIRAELDEQWSVTPNSGIGQQFVYLTPLRFDNRLVSVGRDGVIAVIDSEQGEVLRKVKLDTQIGAGLGGDQSLWLAADRNGDVLAIDAEAGEVRWRRPVNSEVLTAPVLFGDAVYVRTVDGHLLKLDADSGDVVWRYGRVLPSLTLRGNSAPLMTREWVILGHEDGHMIALDHATGAVVWDVELTSPGGRSEIERLVDIDGDAELYGTILYAVGFQGKLAAVDVTAGRVLWARPFSSHSGVSVDDQAIYVTDDRSHIWAIDRFNGATLWKQDALTARAVTRPVVFGDKLVVGDYAGVLHVLSKDDGSFVARDTTGDDENGIFLPPMIDGERIIVNLRSGEIVAFTLGKQLAQQ